MPECGMPESQQLLKSLRSPRNLKLLALAFGAGLLLFLFILVDQRNDTDFFRASDSADTSGEQDGLPVPLPADVASDDQNASGLSLPPPGQQRQVLPNGEQPRIIEPDGAYLPPPQSAPLPPDYGPGMRGTDSPPVPISRTPPVYPREAIRRGIGGTVRVQVTVASNGNVERMEVAQTSGNRFLDRAAMEAVRRWRFTPALRNGQPVSATVVIPVDFTP